MPVRTVTETIGFIGLHVFDCELRIVLYPVCSVQRGNSQFVILFPILKVSISLNVQKPE